MPGGPRLDLRFVSPATAKQMAGEPDVLALVTFGEARMAGDSHSPWLHTGLRPLGESMAPVQCWRTNSTVHHERAGRFAVHRAEGLAMLACSVDDDGDPAAAAESLYLELVAAADSLGFPHLLRIWQYLPRITESLGDEDRYKAYCAGRRRALNRLHRHRDTTLPAACLLGDYSDSILMYALVAERPGVQVENPRQVSAFQYPPQYGRASPSFSRALAVAWPGDSRQLYISGTASVVGHATMHDTVEAQARETLANLDALLAAARDTAGIERGSLADINPMTVYVRRAQDYPTVRGILEERLPAGHPVLYLHAEVCRPGLLVEVEGVASVNHSG